MTRPILCWPDPVLLRPAAPVERFDDALAELAREMLDAMYAAPGRGLAAPQVGVALRLFVMDVGWKDGRPEPRVVVNPRLSEPSEERVEREEGCLSLPGFTVLLSRPAEVTIEYQGLDGALRRERLAGFAATCAQHEADHLDGILTVHRLDAAGRASVARALAAVKART